MYNKDGRPKNNSNYNKNEKGSGKDVFIFIVLVLVIVGLLGLWLKGESEPQEREVIETQGKQVVELQDEPIAEVTEEESPTKLTVEQKELLQEKIEKELAEREKEEGTADFFYKRALKKEGKKDYDGAVEDYSRAVELAKRYSAEMWNSLNNRGIIRAKKFKDYKGATKDFNRIIQIETNRSDGEVNAVRLEAGYTNRAYVKKMLGNKEGACDDLYEALGLGVEASVDFIEQKIDENCL
jgi:tetratricopeptide (TPR) repeat protein